MARFLGAFTAFLFGCGIMALLVGLLWGWLSWQSGVMGMAGLWVTALTAAAFLERGRDYSVPRLWLLSCTLIPRRPQVAHMRPRFRFKFSARLDTF